MIIFLILLLLVIILLLLNITIKIESNNLKFRVVIKFLSIVIFDTTKKDNKSIQNNSKEDKNDDNFKFSISKVKDILSFIKNNVPGKIKISNYNINYRFGFNDAAQTGIYSGVVYAGVYSLDAYLSSNYKIKKKSIEITPDFDNKVNEFILNLLLKIKLIDLVILLIKGLTTVIKK